MMRAPFIRLNDQQGFTLIEVMVALFVFAVGVSSLIVAQTDSLQTTAALEDRLYAEVVAENILVETVTSPEFFEAGFTYGEETQAGRTYLWARQVRPSGRETIDWVEIKVRLKARRPTDQADNPVLFSLSGFRRQQ